MNCLIKARITLFKIVLVCEKILSHIQEYNIGRLAIQELVFHNLKEERERIKVPAREAEIKPSHEQLCSSLFHKPVQ